MRRCTPLSWEGVPPASRRWHAQCAVRSPCAVVFPAVHSRWRCLAEIVSFPSLSRSYDVVFMSANEPFRLVLSDVRARLQRTK